MAAVQFLNMSLLYCLLQFTPDTTIYCFVYFKTLQTQQFIVLFISIHSRHNSRPGIHDSTSGEFGKTPLYSAGSAGVGGGHTVICTGAAGTDSGYAGSMLQQHKCSRPPGAHGGGSSRPASPSSYAHIWDLHRHHVQPSTGDEMLSSCQFPQQQQSAGYCDGQFPQQQQSAGYCDGMGQTAFLSDHDRQPRFFYDEGATMLQRQGSTPSSTYTEGPVYHEANTAD